ncbi:MBL fold metallo-hydrolase [Jiulongibacter sediminis]|uniref:MBL fold metallo-hydrolase n=1 Tax=Jiulongibacter sediminis TaxID=1605367 RepID=UPI0026EF0097|nr:MBL fold metallo-hydrolase [Jiulongibacter sediminis]
MKNLLSFLLISSVCYAQQDFSAVEMKTTEITPHIFMIEGSGGNIGLFTNEEVTFIIDDQFGPLAEKIQSAVSEQTERPIDFVINTHYHGDHSGSNPHFEKEGAYVIAQENVRTRLKEEQSEGLPKLTFPFNMHLYFGDEEIEIFHQSRAHTNGDAIIHFKTSNVFHTGDVFVRYGFPYIDVKSGGNINGMIEFLDTALRKMDDESVIIPGHGQLAKKQDVLDFRNMIYAIRNNIRTGISSGLSLEEIQALDPTAGYPDPRDSKKGFVEGVYHSLVGE